MDWGGANSRFLGLVSVWAARSFDQTALRPSVIKWIRQIDVKYITHITSFGVTAWTRVTAWTCMCELPRLIVHWTRISMYIVYWTLNNYYYYYYIISGLCGSSGSWFWQPYDKSFWCTEAIWTVRNEIEAQEMSTSSGFSGILRTTSEPGRGEILLEMVIGVNHCANEMFSLLLGS